MFSHFVYLLLLILMLPCVILFAFWCNARKCKVIENSICFILSKPVMQMHTHTHFHVCYEFENKNALSILEIYKYSGIFIYQIQRVFGIFHRHGTTKMPRILFCSLLLRMHKKWTSLPPPPFHFRDFFFISWNEPNRWV